MQRRQAGVADIGICALLQQKERKRHLASSVATSKGVAPSERRRRQCDRLVRRAPPPAAVAGLRGWFTFRDIWTASGCDSEIDVHARGQQQTGAFDIAFASGKVQRGKSAFRARQQIGFRVDKVRTTSGWCSAAAHINAVWFCIGSLAFTSASPAINRLTASALPLLAQVMTGVTPVAIGVFGFAPAFRSRSTNGRACRWCRPGTAASCESRSPRSRQRRRGPACRRFRMHSNERPTAGRSSHRRPSIDVDALIEQRANCCWSWFRTASISRRSTSAALAPAAKANVIRNAPVRAICLPLLRMPVPLSSVAKDQ